MTRMGITEREDQRLDEATLLRAIALLKDELTAIINAGLAQVQASVKELQTEQTDHLLDQERRNGGFASRDQVESLARDVSRRADEIARLHKRDDESMGDRLAIRDVLAEMERNASQARIAGLTRGYSAMGAAALALVGIAVQLFFHFMK